MARNAGIGGLALVWIGLAWLWWVVPEGREYTPGPNSGEMAVTAHGAIENAWLMWSVFIGFLLWDWMATR